MNKERNLAIDFLKGFAMLLIILIHVTVYFRDNMIAHTLWEYSQVAVPIFVFCSAYLYFSRTKEEHFNIIYFWKRIKRLVLPYYVFLFLFIGYSLLFKQTPLSFEIIVRKMFFLNISSRDLDWLVVLFLYFMILMPFIRILSKQKILFCIYICLSFFSSIWLLFNQSESLFRLLMWLPWSLVLIVTFFVVRYENRHGFTYLLSALFFIFYILSRGLVIFNNAPITLTDNKYPPNIFYLSYGISLTLLFYKSYDKLGFINTFFNIFFGYLSKHSYSIFFIHFLVLYFFLDFTNYKKLEWWGLFTSVICITLLSQKLLDYLFSILKRGPTI